MKSVAAITVLLVFPLFCSASSTPSVRQPLTTEAGCFASFTRCTRANDLGACVTCVNTCGSAIVSNALDAICLNPIRIGLACLKGIPCATAVVVCNDRLFNIRNRRLQEFEGSCPTGYGLQIYYEQNKYSTPTCYARALVPLFSDPDGWCEAQKRRRRS